MISNLVIRNGCGNGLRGKKQKQKKKQNPRMRVSLWPPEFWGGKIRNQATPCLPGVYVVKTKLTRDKWIGLCETAACLSGESRIISLLASFKHNHNYNILDHLSLSYPAPLSLGHPYPVTAAHGLAG